MKRKIFLGVSVVSLVLGSIFAYAEEVPGEESTAAVWDAKTDVTKEEQLEWTHFSLSAPQDAENVSYNVLLISQEYPIAETVFEMNGHEFYIRAQATDLFELKEGDTKADISGLYYEWDTVKQNDVKYCQGYIYCSEEAGYVAWLDVAPGVLYNLGTTGETNPEELAEMAELSFKPLQGEVEGDTLTLKTPENIEHGITTLPLGMIMTPIHYENGELTVSIENQTGAESGYGNAYRLQKKVEEEWIDMEPVEDFFWTEEFYILQDTEAKEETYDLSVYGTLEPGDYKLIKSDFEAEFTLEMEK